MSKSVNQEIPLHPKATKAFLLKLRELASALPCGFDPNKGLSAFTMHEGVSFYIDSHLEDYNELLRRLSKLDQSAEKFTEGYLREKLNSLIAALLKNKETNLQPLYEEIAREIANYNIKQTVFLPVFGISLSNDIRVGNVTFKPTSDELFNSEAFKSFIKRNGELLANQITKDFQGSNTTATIEVVAQPERAKERALQEVARAFELIRFAIACLYGYDSKIEIGLIGEVLLSTTTSIALGTDNSFSITNAAIGPIQPFPLSELTNEIQKDLGFDLLSRMLQKKNLNDFELMILRCLHWFSTATIQKERENKLLNLTTCLEAAFTAQGPNGAPIANSIAEGMALFLMEKLEDRQRLKKRIKSLYSKRSDVSHGGDAVVQVGENFELQRYAGWLIVALTKRSAEFESRKQFLSMIENIKLS